MSNEAPETWHALLLAYGRLSTQLSATLEQRFQVSLAEFEALLWIYRAGGEPVQANDLAARLLITQSGLTRMLNRLEVAGLVVRTPSEADRRCKDITLTESGTEAVAAMRQDHLADIDVLIGSKLDADELRELTRLLGRLVAD